VTGSRSARTPVASAVGAKVVIGGGTTVNAYLDVSIGDGALIADDVHITDFDHRTDRLDVPIKDQGVVTAPVRIGPDVWLGRGVTVLRGVDIGRGSVIGAHCVVTRDIPPYSVAVGAPRVWSAHDSRMSPAEACARVERPRPHAPRPWPSA
jgi:acetyltransferase-like isoleucine patch superfamily enzyme